MAVPSLAKSDREFKVPFKAKTVVVSEEMNNGCIDTDHVGTGTHLGRFDLSETLCFTATGFTVDGTLVAANGDELYFYVVGTFTATGFSSTGWVFDGGTGRFENATGQAGETLFRDPVTNAIVAITVNGFITY
jgi:hypothetical protein